MGNSVLAGALDGVIARLREGKGFGRPLAETGLYPQLATQMILVGEESGRLEEMLDRVADVYDREVQLAIKRFLAVLEPALILGAGGADRRHRVLDPAGRHGHERTRAVIACLTHWAVAVLRHREIRLRPAKGLE